MDNVGVIPYAVNVGYGNSGKPLLRNVDTVEAGIICKRLSVFRGNRQFDIVGLTGKFQAAKTKFIRVGGNDLRVIGGIFERQRGNVNAVLFENIKDDDGGFRRCRAE